MPYKHVWFDAPKNENLPILKELPEGVTIHEPILGDLRRAWGKQHDYYYCRYCQGWIEGKPNIYEINTLNSSHLSGRQGEEFYCLRCGKQIEFIGIMS